METTLAIEVQGLTKSLGDREVLKEISFSLNAGEVLGYIGLNGAGKTTTIKHLLGFLHPDRGIIRIMGLPPLEATKKGMVGFMPERPYFYDYLTGHELLMFFGKLSGLSGKGLKARVSELFETVGLKEARNLPLRLYSKGMVQRIGLAQALLTSPKLLILDEPLNGLDPSGRYEITNLLLSLKEKGTSLIVTSHILPDVERLCDTIAIIHQGKIIRHAPLDELLVPVPNFFMVTLVNFNREWVESLKDTITRMEDRGGALTLDTNEKGKNQILEGIQKGSAKLVSLSPRRPTLEEILLSSTHNAA